MNTVLKRACSLAMRTSNAEHSPKPPPTATPLTAAIIGLSALWTFRMVRPTRPIASMAFARLLFSLTLPPLPMA